MNHRMRRIVETLACERRYGIADAKGAEYSGKGSTYKETGADTLANFKNVAERIGGTPEQVLMTYLLKHIDSINTSVREVGQAAASELAYNPVEMYAAGEGIVSRLDDARNYLDLLECLLIDNKHIEPVRDKESGLYAHVLRAERALEAAKITNPARWVEPPTAEPGDVQSDVTPCPCGTDLCRPSVHEEAEIARFLSGPDQEGVPEGSIRGFDGVIRPQVSPEGTKIIPPLSWGETGELNG